MVKRLSEGKAPAVSEGKEGFSYVPVKGKTPFAEKLTRNAALAALLVLAVTVVKNQHLPGGETVQTAVRQLVSPEWDQRLGAIDFVGSFLPETAAVFFDSGAPKDLTAPCLGSVVHAWMESEPYLSYTSPQDGKVYASAAGQVMSVAHGPEEEIILRIRHDGGVETMVYGLREAYVREGDEVTADTCVGVVIPGEDAVLEVRRAGRAVDPTAWMRDR